MGRTEDAVAFLESRARLSPAAPNGGWPQGAPEREFTRSPAAAVVGELAAASGLFLFHREHRVPLDLPDHWAPAGQEDLARAPHWEAGLLPEEKYQGFRHDQAIGGFNPGHRAKWSTHELLHGLVGFGAFAQAPPLFIATAGRLAELLPVALWYFFDEAWGLRCPVHQPSGALFRDFCADCERHVGFRPVDDDAADMVRGGFKFVDRELAAIAASRRLGRPVTHQWATLDLCSDGLAYADAHGPRLRSEAFRGWLDRCTLPEAGGWRSLEALEARVVAVLDAFAGRPPEALVPDRVAGQWRWTFQDLAARIAQVAEDTDGEAFVTLDGLVDRLGEEIQATARPGFDGLAAEAVCRSVIADYQALAEDYVVPEARQLFAVGYDLPGGYGRDASFIALGLSTALPVTHQALEDLGPSLVERFTAEDPLLRAPLGQRFAVWLREAHPGALADLAAFEAAQLEPSKDPLLPVLGAWHEGPMRLASGMTVVVQDFNALALAEAVDAGNLSGRWVDGQPLLVDSDGIPVESEPGGLVVGLDPAGELLLLDVPSDTAAQLIALGDGGDLDIDQDELELLAGNGVIAPARWPLGLEAAKMTHT